MSVESVKVEELIALREREFIEKRLLISQWVTLVMGNVRKVDPRLMEGIAIPNGNTAEELIPSLFAPTFDEATYANEIEVLTAIQRRYNEIAAKLNEEALKWLSPSTAQS